VVAVRQTAILSLICYPTTAIPREPNLVHFAAFKNHIGFYPAPSGIEAFKNELAIYKSAKGSVQFPIHRPLPLTLISEIVKFRITENLKNVKIKSSKKK